MRARTRSNGCYDGKTFTVYGKKVKYYASAPAPATIGALMDAVNERFDVSLPLAELFIWGTDKAPVQDITSALYVGPATIGGIPTDHSGSLHHLPDCGGPQGRAEAVHIADRCMPAWTSRHTSARSSNAWAASRHLT
jgi:hypothetical protein